MAVKLYDHDEKTIYAVVTRVHQKWARKADTEANLKLFEKEIIGRLAEAGYEARVDWTRVPTDVVILSVPDRNELDFDFDKKSHEVKQARKKGER